MWISHNQWPNYLFSWLWLARCVWLSLNWFRIGRGSKCCWRCPLYHHSSDPFSTGGKSLVSCPRFMGKLGLGVNSLRSGIRQGIISRLVHWFWLKDGDITRLDKTCQLPPIWFSYVKFECCLLVVILIQNCCLFICYFTPYTRQMSENKSKYCNNNRIMPL